MSATTANTLDAAIHEAMLDGYTLDTQGPDSAVLRRKAPVKWKGVVLLSILTAGIFLLILPFRVINRKTDTLVLTVDAETGRAQRVVRRA